MEFYNIVNEKVCLIRNNLDKSILLSVYIDKKLRWINVQGEYEIEGVWRNIEYCGNFLNRKYPAFVWSELEDALIPLGFKFHRGYKK